MSNTSTLALGLGSGLALWYATKHTSKPPQGAASSSSATTTPKTQATARNAVRIDSAGITVDGTRLDIAAAARRCAGMEQLAVAVAPDAPASTCVALMNALSPNVATIRNARRQTAAPSERALASTFTLAVFPEGIWGSTKRVRYFTSEPPTTWEDARDRLRAAKLIDPDAQGPNNAGAWRLIVAPGWFRHDLAEPLPGDPRPRGATRAVRGTQRYTHEGRTILRDGHAILRIDRVDLGDERYAVSPHQADRLTERVVRLLDQHGAG